MQSIFDKFIPPSLMSAFRKHVDTNLRVKEDNSVLNWIDIDKFMDHSIILFLRFNRHVLDNINKLYYAWTLFSTDCLDFDQVYLLLKFMAP